MLDRCLAKLVQMRRTCVQSLNAPIVQADHDRAALGISEADFGVREISWRHSSGLPVEPLVFADSQQPCADVFFRQSKSLFYGYG